MTDIKSEASLGACITGAGPAHAELRHTDAGATEVVCTARTAGDYVLSVFDLSSGASLFGSPYQVTSEWTNCWILLQEAHLQASTARKQVLLSSHVLRVLSAGGLCDQIPIPS